MTITTRLHVYRYDVSVPRQRKQYLDLCDRLRETNGKCFRVISVPTKGRVPLDTGEVTLETEHLFANQWNTTTHRVFDWYEGINDGESIKTGHYLDITDEMREIRRNTNVCGFCGHQEAAAKGLVFCDRCMDSPYLKTTDIHLTRMMSVSLNHPERSPLTEAELAHLMPEYRNAQQLAKRRADIIARCDKQTLAATTERDGLLWLMDHGFDTENVIYYDHDDRFGFGWRHPVSDEVASEILGFISEFPYRYQITSVSRIYENY